MGHQQAELEWRNGNIPMSVQFQDPYFSLENGLEETRHVFLAGNRLPDRFRKGFHIAELGFGTGLNMFAALIEWRKSGIDGHLRFTSFEAFPIKADQMVRALDAFPEARRVAEPFIAAWAEGETEINTDDLHATIIRGDARATLSSWPDKADAWFLDGFSPKRNPEMWENDLLLQVAQHTQTSGTLATYTSAGFVRRNLEAAGFEVERVQGYGRKRHMTIARMPT